MKGRGLVTTVPRERKETLFVNAYVGVLISFEKAQKKEADYSDVGCMLHAQWNLANPVTSGPMQNGRFIMGCRLCQN